jgi:hypothetical protein
MDREMLGVERHASKRPTTTGAVAETAISRE